MVDYKNMQKLYCIGANVCSLEWWNRQRTPENQDERYLLLTEGNTYITQFLIMWKMENAAF